MILTATSLALDAPSRSQLPSTMSNKIDSVREYIDRYPYAPDCHWEAEEFDLDILPSRVQCVHFCAAGNDNDNHTRKEPVNHWMFFLQTSDASSVRVSISSGETSAHPSLIELSSKRYIVSRYSPAVLSFSVALNVTVEAIFRLIIMRGRDRYYFNDEGIGCRWWTYCVAKDMEQMGWIEQDASTRVYQTASYYYPRKRRDAQGSLEPTVCPIRQGKFF
ncbi:hypothetical protein CYLTODRAFT_370558 [Cylindrobasidium torrendii FP15055 ss-10]|uniref:DUF7770 domain-containing protein n=1 Tax=Cylindrobasidium torrendii FP15055 ss-10 TaxID=1314674 RepID=A0A0D7BJQ0_9AGAR|nr:hypothetical protein CYLTODRAFT_370558 [Cylindrobasidium torrendii FP15055 ss-10]